MSRPAYVIIERPAGMYAANFAVRRWLIDDACTWKEAEMTDDVWGSTTLKEARGFVPDGFKRRPRGPNDEPGVVEWWA